MYVARRRPGRRRRCWPSVKNGPLWQWRNWPSCPGRPSRRAGLPRSGCRRRCGTDWAATSACPDKRSGPCSSSVVAALPSIVSVSELCSAASRVFLPAVPRPRPGLGHVAQAQHRLERADAAVVAGVHRHGIGVALVVAAVATVPVVERARCRRRRWPRPAVPATVFRPAQVDDPHHLSAPARPPPARR